MLSRVSLPGLKRTITRSRPLRLAVQAGVAGVATFAIGNILGLVQLSWAVISALFVIQASIGGTVGSAIGRIIGAVLGAAIGLAWAFAGGTQNLLLTGLGLAVAGAATAYLAGLRPALRYGSVTAAIIILHPGSDPLVQAGHFSAAIGVGAVVGALTSAFVFPWKARLGISEELGNAVRRCADLLQACVRGIIGREADELDPIHRDIRRSLEDARAAARPSRNERFRRTSGELDPETLIRSVERLWHVVIMIDRTDSGALPEEPRRELAPRLEAVSRACCDYLAHLGAALAAAERPDPPGSVRDENDALQRALAEMRKAEAVESLATWEAERIFALAFAFDQLNRNIAELACDLGAPTESGERGT